MADITQDNIEELSEEIVVSPGDEIEEVEEPIVNPLDNAGVSAVMFVYQSIGAAQNAKGGLSMDDCERILEARNILLEFYAKNAEKTKEVFNAYIVLNSSCQFHQKQGAFSIEGSVRLKQNLAVLERVVTIEEQPKPANRAEVRAQAKTQARPAQQPPQQPRGKQAVRGKGKAVNKK